MPTPRQKARAVSDSCLCLHLRKAARSLTGLYDEALVPAGLKITQFSLLSSATAIGDGPLSALADELGLDRTTLTRNLAPLVRQGLIELKTGKDRRQRVVAVTEAGREALAKALPRWEKANDRVAGRFGGKRSRKLFKELEDLVTTASRRKK